MFDIIGKRRWFYAFSLIITIPGLIFILLTPFGGGKVGLQFSIDFTGGTELILHFDRPEQPAPGELREAMLALDIEGSATRGDDLVYIRTVASVGLVPATPSPSPTSSPTPSASAAPSTSPGGSASASPTAAPTPTASLTPSPSPAASAVPSASPGIGGPPQASGKLGELFTLLGERFGPFEVRQQQTIGPLISGELALDALKLFLAGSIGILAWMTFRFGDLRMGLAALAALVHDIVVVLGIFAVLGTFFRLQIDALFVTAMLTVIGFSVHDTIVVFDRVRENRIRHAGEPFSEIVNHSLLQTLGRSLNTSLTTVMVLTALLLFGADSIRSFVFAMVIGIISGTYSSIFNASALLVTWHEWSEERRQREFATVRGR